MSDDELAKRRAVRDPVIVCPTCRRVVPGYLQTGDVVYHLRSSDLTTGELCVR